LRLACEHDVPALSQSVWDELVEVLHRPRLARFIDPGARDQVLALLRASAAWFEPVLDVRDCRDARDDRYLELALAAAAHTIVSSDEDLLVLHPWRAVQIVRPARYLLLQPLVPGR
jgi:putative PIN family toxin of toxin-antitoxin system